MPQKKKILIAIDGSKSSMDAIEYSSGFFNPEVFEITFMHIMDNMPDGGENQQSDKSLDAANIATDAWYQKRTEQILKKIKGYVNQFENAGYDKQTLNVIIRKQIKGIANDIIAESEQGYDALVIGRRGLNDPTSIMVGATAYRMMKAINHLPVVIVGESPDPENVLIGLDESDNAFRSLDCVCELMPRPLRKILICHISQRMDKEENKKKAFTAEELNQQLEIQRNRIKTLMQKAEDRLTDAGFEQTLIEKEILEGILSRAVAISKTAEKHNCGSVVVGRRGLSMIREFMMGRVTMKILHKAHTQAVWIV